MQRIEAGSLVLTEAKLDRIIVSRIEAVRADYEARLAAVAADLGPVPTGAFVRAARPSPNP